MVEEIDRVKRRIRLTPSTLFLADFIAKNYLEDKSRSGKNFSRKEMIEVAYGALFLAAKMRERDIYCPMIPHILQAGGNRIFQI
jgi:hypothetical protein